MEQARVDQILDTYGCEESSLLAIMQDIQAEAHWLPKEALQCVADRVGVSMAHLYRLATFFEAFHLEPRGKHIWTVCMGTACHVRGAPLLSEKLQRDMVVDDRGNTSDMEHTVESVNCVGACALGPLIIVDGKYHGNMNSGKVDRVYKDHGIEPMTGGTTHGGEE
jgi:NADH-quinone oxidoreductase subunit E